MLSIVTFGLVVLVIGDRLAGARRTAEPVETANQTMSAAHTLDSDTVKSGVSAGRAGPAGRPAVDRVARMATRQ